jgi:hypothetical protein
MTNRVITAMLGVAGAAMLAACSSSSTGPAASRNSPGTGTSTLNVTAEIDANDDPTIIGGFSTDYKVSVRDALGNKVSGATVTITNASLGTITLPETAAGSGDYALTGNTFPSGDFQLDVVKGTDNVKGVVLGGPGVHTVTTPVANSTVPAGQPLSVRWTVPSQAQSAEVQTNNFGPVTLPDTGAYVISGANNPANPSQQLRVFRFNKVNIAGGLPGSQLEVKVRRTVAPFTVQ